MFCAKCGTVLPEDAVVCYRCAAPTSGANVQPKARTNTLLIVVAVIAAIIILPIAGFFVLTGIGTIGWQAANRAGNEAAAAQTIDIIRKFQAQYAARNKGKYGSFDEL